MFLTGRRAAEKSNITPRRLQAELCDRDLMERRGWGRRRREGQVLERVLCSSRRRCSSGQFGLQVTPKPSLFPLLLPSIPPFIALSLLLLAQTFWIFLVTVSPQVMDRCRSMIPEGRGCCFPHSSSKVPEKMWISPATIGRASLTRSVAMG